MGGERSRIPQVRLIVSEAGEKVPGKLQGKDFIKKVEQKSRPAWLRPQHTKVASSTKAAARNNEETTQVNTSLLYSTRKSQIHIKIRLFPPLVDKLTDVR